MPTHRSRQRCITLLMTGLLTVFHLTVVAQPSWAGKGKSEKHVQKEAREHGRSHEHKGKDDDRKGKKDKGHRFADRDRTVIFEYFNESYRSGHCPPGLAKKHNGCMPPGQAKKWVIGRALPPDVEFYELPPAVLIRLEPPPVGHRYVRVARDILMIAVGTGMVVDALQDLSR